MTRRSHGRASSPATLSVIMATNDHRRPALHIQHVYDVRLVRASEAPLDSVVAGGDLQLADRVRRILLPGSGQPHRLWPLQRLSAENYSGIGHPGGVRRLRILLSRRRPALELRGLLRVHPGGGRVRLLGEVMPECGEYGGGAASQSCRSAGPPLNRGRLYSADLMY